MDGEYRTIGVCEISGENRPLIICVRFNVIGGWCDGARTHEYLSGTLAGTVHRVRYVSNDRTGCSLPDMAFVRILLGALVAMLVVVIAVPAVVLFDLVVGGTGLGLCPTGLGTCTTSAFTVMELLGILGLSVAIVGAGIVGCLRLLHRSRPKY